MSLRLAYGSGSLTVEIPGNLRVDRYAPRRAECPVDFERFAAALDRAGGDSFLSSDGLICVINDGYRNTPTPLMLSWLEKMQPGFVDGADFLMAVGTHAPPTTVHLDATLGSFRDRIEPKLVVHDCRDESRMAVVGRDMFGAQVLLNRLVLDGRPVLVLGSVEPHYFGGYTGGRKAFFPGLTDLATVVRNHNLANSMDAMPLRLAGNPVAEHFDNLMSLVATDRMFSIQVVLDARGRMAGVAAGDIVDSFTEATKIADQMFLHMVPHRYDVILCEVLPPLDTSLYQVQKALENVQAAVRDKGSVVVVAACEEGVGSPHFFELAGQWDRENNCALDGQQHFGSHKLSRVNAMTSRIRVRLVTNMDHTDARKVFYEPLDNLQEFLFRKWHNDSTLSVAVVRDAGNTVLRR